MRQWAGDVWQSEFPTICVPTNMIVKKNGEAVMGGGLALAANNVSGGEAAKILGQYLKRFPGHGVFPLCTVQTPVGEKLLVSFPTKDDWKNKSSKALIAQSARVLGVLVRSMAVSLPVALPKPGCGLGGLTWDASLEFMLKQSLGAHAPDHIVIVDKI